MKNWMLGVLVATSLSFALAPTTADAKRFGGGKSTGMQRSSADAAPAKPAAPQQATPSQATPAQGMPPAAAPKRNWMGPLAGLAAGLGIAALMSHFGMGEAFGNMIMMALLAVVAVVAIRFLMNRFGKAKPAGLQMAGAGAGSAWSGSNVNAAPARTAEASPFLRTNDAPPAANTSAYGAGAPALGGVAAAAPAFAPAAASGPAVPADFDSEGFGRLAKMIFIRMQAANDTGDINDLRSFTTPEMFAVVKMDLQERGATGQTTDVVKVDTEVLSVAQEGERQVVSVRFHGQIREELNGPVSDFDEVWHLVRFGDGPSWAISGIQQRS